MLNNTSCVVENPYVHAHTLAYMHNQSFSITYLAMLFSWDFIVIYENECVTCVTSVKE